MTMKTKLHYEVANFLVGREVAWNEVDELAADVLRVRRIALKLKRLDEMACNGYGKMTSEYRDGKFYRYQVWDEALQERSERQEAKLEAQLAEIGKKYSCEIVHQPDPRGWSVQGFEVDGIRLGEFVNRPTR